MSPDARVEGLIAIADGGRDSWWCPYRYEAQIQAIRDLGHSASLKALEYLEGVYFASTREEITEYVTLHGQGAGDCNPYDVDVRAERVEFPKAKRKLKEALSYVIRLEEVQGQGWIEPLTEELVENSRADILIKEPHSTFLTAITELRKALQ